MTNDNVEDKFKNNYANIRLPPPHSVLEMLVALDREQLQIFEKEMIETSSNKLNNFELP